MHALVVDDDDGYRDLYKANLEKLGYEVIEACNGAEGLLAVGAQTFDLVLCDITMPVLDGVEFLKVVRLSYPRLPVIIISGGSRYEASYILSLGATAYIDKARIDFKKISEIITEWHTVKAQS